MDGLPTEARVSERERTRVPTDWVRECEKTSRHLMGNVLTQVVSGWGGIKVLHSSALEAERQVT